MGSSAKGSEITDPNIYSEQQTPAFFLYCEENMKEISAASAV
jgi:hypothetical protein